MPANHRPEEPRLDSLPAHDDRPARRRLAVLGAATLAIALVLVLAFRGGSDTDGDDPEADESTAAPEGSSDIPNPFLLPDGSTISIEVFVDDRADTTIIAAASRNADISSLRPVGDVLAGQGCANVIAFDASTVQTDPASVYAALLEAVADGQIVGPGPTRVGTLGASFTGLPAWEAARDAGAEFSFAFAPSDRFPDDAAPDGVPVALVFVGEDDTGFLPQFEQWREAGINGATLPGGEHGSALFIGENDDVVLSRLERALCF